MIEVTSSGELWSGLTIAVLREQDVILERHLTAIIQPRPRWVPKLLWYRVLGRVLALQERR